MYEKLYTAIESYDKDMVNLMLKLLSFDTVMHYESEQYPTGRNVAECLDFVLSYCKDLGFRVHNHRNLYGYAEYGEPSAPYILSVAHLDVVPVGDLSKWTRSSSGEFVDGMFYGRGACDNKHVAVSIIFALKALVEAGGTIDFTKSRLRIAFGTAEETTMEDLEEYSQVESEPLYTFIPDATYPCVYAEKGCMHYRITGNINDDVIHSIKHTDGAVNIIPDVCIATLKNVSVDKLLTVIQEKYNNKNCVVELRECSDKSLVELAVNGVGGHGSRPEICHNAITLFFSLVKDLVGDKSMLANFYNDLFADYYADALGFSHTDKISGKTTNTLNVVSFAGGNFLAEVDCRYSIESKSSSDIIPKLEEHIVTSYGFDLDAYIDWAPHYVPKEGRLVSTIEKTYAELSGVHKDSIAVGSATYARKVPGAVAVGTGLDSKKGNAHREDEYSSLQGMILDTKMYATLFARLSECN